ncbi:MAG: hypothetical protein ACFE8E_13780 [Candidatus Hodarchaeota archaeon]
MINYTDYSKEIRKKIEIVKEEVLSGKLNLLNLELDPIFQDLKNTLNKFNIDIYSSLYKEACLLLKNKFEELKAFLRLLESDKLFFKFLNYNPNDDEIASMFQSCWRIVFNIETISIDFLAESDKKYSKQRNDIFQLTHLKQKKVDSEFLLEIAQHNFTEKMFLYLERIKEKLPCKFENIFEGEKDQTEIFENFVYLLHLLQLGRIKYQKETKSLYI